MYLMYVDDSGSPNLKDQSRYYVITGIILHESLVRDTELKTQRYILDNFREYGHCEIHVHDINKGKKCFSSLTLWRKQEILNGLYEFINTLPITVITVGINKQDITNQYINPQIFDSAWKYLIERFDSFICDNGENNNEGIVIVDSSSKIPEKEISKIVKNKE